MISKKEIRRLGVMLLILFILVGIGFYISPKQINLTYDATEYRIGNLHMEKHIKINLNGFYYKKILSKDTFEGSITIEKKELKRVKLVIGIENTVYDVSGDYAGYGILFATNRLKQLTIGLLENNGWNSVNGLMISAPSKNRSEALRISNNLMNGVLKKVLN